MIIPYLTQDQFILKLTITIILQIIIMVCMINFAQRQPTDYDTKYMRRWRIIMGIMWLILAFSEFFAVNEYSLPFYYFATYGTMTPTEDVINTGVSKDLMLYPNVVWGHLTFKQWLVEGNIENALRSISLGLYFILFKPSSVKKWVKVRKFMGYFILLFILPAAFNFHYFSLIEFAFVIIICIIVWLLVRNYKHDSIQPIINTVPLSYDGTPIEDFIPIPPSGTSTMEHDIQDNNTHDNLSCKAAEHKKKKRQISRKWQIVSLCILNVTLFITSIIIAILAYHSCNDDYRYFSDWGLYSEVYMEEQGYKYIDKNLGTPIHPKRSLYVKLYNGDYTKEGANGYNQPMYVRFLNYKTNNQYNSLFEYLKELEYPCEYEINESSRIVYWDKIYQGHMLYRSYGAINETYYWTRKHIIQERNDTVYETIIYMLDDEIYDNTIEHKFTIDSPYSRSLTYQWFYFITCILWIISVIIILILYSKILKKQNRIKNLKAYKLLVYMSICLIIEYAVHIIIALANIPLYQDNLVDLFIFIGIFSAYLVVVRIPLLVYVCKQICTEPTYYLAPRWLQNFIKTYSISEAPIRTSVAFILYPLFYLCTLPLGIVFLVYVIPAAIIYIIALFINWAINGMKKPTE